MHSQCRTLATSVIWETRMIQYLTVIIILYWDYIIFVRVHYNSCTLQSPDPTSIKLEAVLKYRKLFCGFNHVSGARNWHSWEKAKSQLEVVAATTSIVLYFKLWFDSDRFQARWVVFHWTLLVLDVFWKLWNCDCELQKLHNTEKF